MRQLSGESCRLRETSCWQTCGRTFGTASAASSRVRASRLSPSSPSRLGIGSAAAIFSVIQNVLLDPAPYSDVDRIAYVQIRDASRSEPGGRTAFQTPEFLDYREQSQVFEDVIGGGFEDALLTTSDGTLQFAAGLVTPNTFRFLGVPPQLGRGIVDADAEPGAPPVFVMSQKMWVAQYSMDPGVVGRTFVLNGVPTTCVGVMPPRFTKQAADLWKPMRLDRADPAQQRRYYRLSGKAEAGRYRSSARPRRWISSPAGSRRSIPTTTRRSSPSMWSAGWTASCGSSGRRSTRCLRRSACCCSSRVPTSPTCCSRAQPHARRRWRFARRSAQAAGCWCVNS